MARILVAYGTRHGSTADIATHIATRFTAAGFDTDTLEANLGIDLTKYDALIVGSPMYASSWLPEPTLILIANHQRITDIPIALFSTGMIDVKHPGKLRAEHDAWIEKAFTQEDINLNIIASTTFKGAYHRRNFPFWMRIIDSILRITPQGDYREWDKIEDWANETARTLTQILNHKTDDAIAPSC